MIRLSHRPEIPAKPSAQGQQVMAPAEPPRLRHWDISNDAFRGDEVMHRGVIVAMKVAR